MSTKSKDNPTGIPRANLEIFMGRWENSCFKNKAVASPSKVASRAMIISWGEKSSIRCLRIASFSRDKCFPVMGERRFPKTK